MARRLPGQAERLLASLLRFDLPTASPSRRWLNQALDLTQRYGVTFCDAAYHVHAILERGVFITADERYFRQAREARAIVRLAERRIGDDR